MFYLVSRDTRYQRDETTEIDEEVVPYEVNVYLGGGTHYFYTCNLETENESTSSCGSEYCHEQLVQFYQITDNVVFNFLPLREDYFDKTDLEASFKEVYSDEEWDAQSHSIEAIYDDQKVPAGEKATIAVMDNESHFNITRGACFESIVFRGDYGMLKNDTTLDAKANVKYCAVDETSDLLTYGAVTFSTDSDQVD